MTPKIIKTPEEHELALARVASLMNAAPDSPQEAELELWSLLVEKYEEEHFPIEAPDPISAIEFRMEQQGLERRDLLRYIPSKSKVSEVLSRQRPLSLSMIRTLSAHLKIPAEVLIQEPRLRRRSRGTTTLRKRPIATRRSLMETTR